MPGLADTAQGTKPSDLGPAPAAAPQKSLDDIFASAPAPKMAPAPATGQAQPQPQQAAQPQGQQSLDDIFGGDQQDEPTTAQKALSAGKTSLDVLGRGLDYAGGLIRTGLASVASTTEHALKGEIGNDVTEKDLTNAFKGKAPSSADYLSRLGVPELGNIDLPLFGKVSGRGVAGFVSDIVTDPLTALTKLTKEVPYISKIIGSSENAAKAVGEAVYKSSLTNVAKKAGAESAEAVGNALIEHGAPVGTAGTLAQKVNDISSALGKTRQALYDKATELGATVDMGFPLEKAEAALAKIRSNPGLEPAAAELANMLERYKAAGKVSIDKLSSWKTSLYEALPASSWGPTGRLKGPAQDFKAALASDFAQAIKDAGNKAEKGLGDAVEAVNNKWGPLLDAKSPLAKQAAQEAAGSGRKIDHIVAAIGGAKAWAIKQALDLAGGTAGRTLIGRAIMSQTGSQVINRGIINANRAVQAPPTPDQQDGQQ